MLSVPPPIAQQTGPTMSLRNWVSLNLYDLDNVQDKLYYLDNVLDELYDLDNVHDKLYYLDNVLDELYDLNNVPEFQYKSISFQLLDCH